MVSTTDMSQCNNNLASDNASMLATPTILNNVLLTPPFGAVMEAENVENVEHVGASTSAIAGTSPQLIQSELEAADKFIAELLAGYKSGEVAAHASVSNVHVGNEAEAGVSNLADVPSENPVLETPGSALSVHGSTEAETGVVNFVNDDVPAVNNDVLETAGSVSSAHEDTEIEADVFNPNNNEELEISGSVSNAHVDTETEADVSNPNENNVVEVEGPITSPTENMVTDVTSSPGGDDYDSGDEFQCMVKSMQKRNHSALSLASVKGKAKATTSQMAAGSTGKSVSVPKKAIKRGSDTGNNGSTGKRVIVPKKMVKSSDTGSDGSSMLRKLLDGSAKRLPARQQRPSGPKKNLGGEMRQVEAVPSTSATLVGNTAPRPGCSGAVLPAPDNFVRVPTPTVHLIESDEESEIFSQTTENIVNAYRSLHSRVRREYTESQARLQISEETFRRADEAFRRAEEARRVALETVKRDQRTLEASLKKLRRMERM